MSGIHNGNSKCFPGVLGLCFNVCKPLSLISRRSYDVFNSFLGIKRPHCYIISTTVSASCWTKVKLNTETEKEGKVFIQILYLLSVTCLLRGNFESFCTGGVGSVFCVVILMRQRTTMTTARMKSTQPVT